MRRHHRWPRRRCLAGVAPRSRAMRRVARIARVGDACVEIVYIARARARERSRARCRVTHGFVAQCFSFDPNPLSALFHP